MDDRGGSFDEVAETYGDSRPGYPEEVFALLRERCGLGQGSRVLEIGAGAGQATLPILDHGARVVAIEPGSALAAVLRHRTANRAIEIVEATFEEATLPIEPFDIVASATAFHWVQPEIGLPKAAATLRQDGWLALWWTVFGDSSRPDPFHEELEHILREQTKGVTFGERSAVPYAMDVAQRTSELEQIGGLGPVEVTLIRWEGRHAPAELRQLFATFSPFIRLPEDIRARVLDAIEQLAQDRFDGLVVRPYVTACYLAQRR